jgi:hypothetical protein
MDYINRNKEPDLLRSMENYPVSAIIGARQTGKSTLAKFLMEKKKTYVYLDLEDPDDLSKLQNPKDYLKLHRDKTICIDEIQRKNELFPIIRSLVDKNKKNGQFLILGSASPELLRQSSESLAGRIDYHELSPFLMNELNDQTGLTDYMNRGGFPKSMLAKNDTISFDWRFNFIQTFLERDVRNFGFNIPPENLKRLWKMLAHLNGQLLNYSQLGNSLGVSHTTIKSYIDVLEKTYMLRILKPYSENLKKRLIKSPKVYIKDPGILNTLLNLHTFEDVISHPVYGSIWETIVIEHIIQNTNYWEPHFYRTSNGNEIDLILEKGQHKIAIECKNTSSPKVTQGLYSALAELKINKAFVVAPVNEKYPLKNDVWVIPLDDLINELT